MPCNSCPCIFELIKSHWLLSLYFGQSRDLANQQYHEICPFTNIPSVLDYIKMILDTILMSRFPEILLFANLVVTSSLCPETPA